MMKSCAPGLYAGHEPAGVRQIFAGMVGDLYAGTAILDLGSAGFMPVREHKFHVDLSRATSAHGPPADAVASTEGCLLMITLSAVSGGLTAAAHAHFSDWGSSASPFTTTWSCHQRRYAR